MIPFLTPSVLFQLTLLLLSELLPKGSDVQKGNNEVKMIAFCLIKA